MPTKWLYASSKGQKVFAIYGIGDGTVPTPLYAVGWKKADTDYKKLTDYLQGVKNGTFKTGINFSKWVRIIPNKQGKQGVSVYANGNRAAAKGNDLVSGGTRKGNRAGNTGSSTENSSQKVKFFREAADKAYLDAVQFEEEGYSVQQGTKTGGKSIWTRRKSRRSRKLY